MRHGHIRIYHNTFLIFLNYRYAHLYHEKLLANLIRLPLLTALLTLQFEFLLASHHKNNQDQFRQLQLHGCEKQVLSIFLCQKEIEERFGFIYGISKKYKILKTTKNLKLSQILEEKHYKTFLQKGLDEKSAKRSAEKQAIEDARFVLPNACDTKMIVTMNARSLQNFFTHRCCNRAQWEIREVAKQMLALCLEVAPNIFKKAGPPCLYGKCPEGNMTCGKIVEVREKFNVK